jgi:hypothetical protein
MGHPFALPLIASQEFAATIGLFINLIAALLVFQGTILFLRNDKKWLKTLSVAMLFEAVWFILLIPTSVHHLVGSVFSMNTANVYVGLSYLVQVLLIAPPLIFLSYNLKSPRNPESTRKWIGLAASLFVFGFWFKYLFLWIDTLSPMGPQQATLMSLVGASNSWLTLLIAGLLAVVASLGFYRTNKVNKWLVGTALVLFGSYFIVYDIVSIWVPIYGSFLYLTDFWMVTLLLIGIAVLVGNRKGIQR